MGEMTKWSYEEKQTWAVSKLLEKHKELGRLPHKDDFDVVTLSRIKAFLGPWPKAPVIAGLKEAKIETPKKSIKRHFEVNNGKRGKHLPQKTKKNTL